MTAPPVITICDQDPMLRLVKIALGHGDFEDRDWLPRYFAPEAVDPDRVAAIGAELGLEGCDLRLAPPDVPLARASAGSSVLLCRRASIDRAVIAASPGLRHIRRLGADGKGIDREAAQAAGVQVWCVPRPTLALTAEHALLLMLAASKKLVEADRRCRAADWDRARVTPIRNVAYNWPGLGQLGGLIGRRIGLIGLGQVGLLVAERLMPFGAEVIYAKPSALDLATETRLKLKRTSTEELLATSDIVSLHATWTPETEGLMNAAAFARMKPGAIFVNTSRGALVEERALLEALRSGHLAQAALDTHAVEPRPAGDPLASERSIILTPHIAGGSRQEMLAEIRLFLSGLASAGRTDDASLAARPLHPAGLRPPGAG